MSYIISSIWWKQPARYILVCSFHRNLPVSQSCNYRKIWAAVLKCDYSGIDITCRNFLGLNHLKSTSYGQYGVSLFAFIINCCLIYVKFRQMQLSVPCFRTCVTQYNRLRFEVQPNMKLSVSSQFGLVRLTIMSCL